MAAADRDDVRSGIVEAAAGLLRSHGVRGVTTRAVAQAAGVQAPTIYRLFGDKDGLIDAVAEQVMATYVAGKAVPPDSDPVADLRAGWHTHVDFCLANPELTALLYAPGRGAASPATAAGVDVLRGKVHRLAAAGLLRVTEGRALGMIQAAGTGIVLSLLATPAPARDPGLAEAMFTAVLSGILAEAPAAPEPGPGAVAVTFATVLPDLPALTDAERTLMAEWLQRSLAGL